MASFVRCPEGHVFDAEHSNRCPSCGAMVGEGTDGAKAVEAGAVGDQQARPRSWRLALAAGAIAVTGVVAYLVLHGHGEAPSPPPQEERSRPEQQSAAADKPAPANTEAPRPSPTAEAPGPSAPKPSAQERQMDGPALPSLSPGERAAINAKYKSLLERLERDREVAPIPGSAARYGTYPDGSLVPFIPPAPGPAVAAAAQAGHWSNDAVATAEDLRGRGEMRQGRLASGGAIMETGLWLGSPLSLGLLGNAHFTGGWGLRRDRERGMALFRLGVDRGNMWSALRLTEIYLRGDGVSKSQADAKRYFLLALEREEREPAELIGAAQKGDSSAVRVLAQLDVSLRDLPVNTSDIYRGRERRGLAATAVELLDRGARSDPNAIYKVVLMAERDEAISLPPKTRFELTREAARRGYFEAMNRLGELLLDGPAEIQNVSEAVFWFFAASQFGYNPVTGRKPDEQFAAAIKRLPAEHARILTALFDVVARDIQTGRAQAQQR
jgi:hypothetical protein